MKIICFSFQVLGTDAVYRLIIDSPGEVIANVTAENCSGETCYYTYHSNNLTNTSTVTVDVVGCTVTRLDSRNISTCKRAIVIFSNVFMCVWLHFAILFLLNISTQSVLQKTCWYLMSVGMRHQ